MQSETKNIGVLYLDSREKGSLLAPHTRTALDTLATEAGVAIENARLYRETLEKARIEHELKIAAEIQRALLPRGQPRRRRSSRRAARRCRRASIGGDFFDMQDMPDGQLRLPGRRRRRQGPGRGAADRRRFSASSRRSCRSATTPAQTVDHINKVLTRRAIDARYATLFYGQLSAGRASCAFCNAGHNPPLVFGVGRPAPLESGGMPVGHVRDGAVLRRSASTLQARRHHDRSTATASPRRSTSTARSSARSGSSTVLERYTPAAGRRSCSSSIIDAVQGLRARRRAVRRCDGAGGEVHRAEMTASA